jgi:hypothetical protein
VLRVISTKTHTDYFCKERKKFDSFAEHGFVFCEAKTEIFDFIQNNVLLET